MTEINDLYSYRDDEHDRVSLPEARRPLYVLVAISPALDARACSKLIRRRSLIEGRTLELEAGHVKDLTTVLLVSVTVCRCW